MSKLDLNALNELPKVDRILALAETNAELEKLEYPTPTRMAQEKNLPVEAKMFNHGGRRKTVKK